MTYEDVLKAYVRKTGREWGNTSDEDTETVMFPRLVECYHELTRETGFTYLPRVVVSLGVVTKSTNKYALTTLLSLTTEGVLAVKEITYDGKPLLHRSKDDIDAMNYGILSIPTEKAYAFWEEAGVPYIAIAPFIGVADSTNYAVSYFKKLADPSYSTYTTESPAFASQFHLILAEKMAREYLVDLADTKWTTLREIQLDNKITKMRNHYIPQLTSPKERLGPYGFSHPNDPYFQLTV